MGTYVFWVVRSDAHHPVKRHFGPPLYSFGSRVGKDWSVGRPEGFVVEGLIPLAELKEGHGTGGVLDAHLTRTTAQRSLPDLPTLTFLTLTLYSLSLALD